MQFQDWISPLGATYQDGGISYTEKVHNTSKWDLRDG